jgi:hypothetical protein
MMLNGQALNNGSPLPAPERFLIHGAYGYDLNDDQLLVFTVPGYPAIVLNRIG